MIDVLPIAETYTIKNAKNIINEIETAINFWINKAVELELPNTIIKSIERDFNYLL